MTNSEPESRTNVSTIWVDIVLNGEPAKVSIVTGQAILRIFGFDAPVPGVFEADDILGVISAHQKQLADIDAAIAALPSGWLEDQCREDNHGLIPISDAELEE